MAFCRNCGNQLVDGAKFCTICGTSVINSNGGLNDQRQQQFTGKVYKCPRCGGVLNSFVRNCPTCGFELRGANPISAVREFALKMEAIESRREYENPGFFRPMDYISKTDEQKISLIRSFSVPNTKEDILDFMILATSNVNMRPYDSNQTVSKSEQALNDAWIAKVKQVYEKAKHSYGNEQDFLQIEGFYNKLNADIRKTKRKGIYKWVGVGVAVAALVLIPWIIVGICGIAANVDQKKETARLESIKQVAVEALEKGDYKKALVNAEGLVYKPNTTNGDTEKNIEQWNVTRELLIDEIIEEAEKNGVHLERPTAMDEEIEPENIELTLKYKVIDRGNAVITGYSGDGNNVTIDSKIDGHKVVGIAENAFKDCTTLRSVKFGILSYIETIGDYAFSGCTSLNEINIPSGTKYIGKHAFEGCINLSNLSFSGGSEIDDYAFAGCEKIETIHINYSTERIGKHAFQRCIHLSTLEISGHPEIDDYAFSGCWSLESIEIPYNTKRVGAHAFDGCISLKSVKVADDDTVIEKDAFINCPNLKGRPIQE